MSFSEFLKANNLPELGEQVIDHEDGMVYTVFTYVFNKNSEYVVK